MDNKADNAISWVQAVQARGVVLAIRNGRLSLHPAKSYSQLSDEELVTLRRYRAEIKVLVASGDYPPPIVQPAPQAVTPAAPVEVALPPCPYCGRPCIGASHPEYRTLHWADSVETAHRNREEHDEEADVRQFMATGMISSRMRATAETRKPKMTEEEKQQAERRRQLGWDEGVLNETSGYRRHE